MRIEDIIKPTSPMPLSRKTVLNVMYTQNVLAERFAELMKAHDLSGEQYNVLRILRGQKAAANMCTIQERMIAKNSNTTRLIDKLLLKELVTREVCPNNRRKMEVCITQKGLDLLSELDPKVDAHENFFTSHMSEAELNELNSLLEKFRNQ
ncbi:MAG: MarR family transcriptional regulator [Flavobacterium sp.]|nr:MAG: MarR family transcriptional regulator [Flavobacterium sp.]